MIRIVIADDHTPVREAWSFVLGQYAHINIIAQCASGQEAIEAARDLNPDIILMDINMRPVSGIEATKIIKEFAPGIKIICVSVQSQRAYVHEMLRNGADGYVTKNSPGKEMILAIEHVLAGNIYLCKEVNY